MKAGGYEIDIVVQGYPGKSVCHGGLGWSTIVLLRGHGRVALIDTGGFGIRKTLIERLNAEAGAFGVGRGYHLGDTVLGSVVTVLVYELAR